jgi:hypothetical protein
LNSYEICKKIQSATCSIAVELEGEIISRGTGWSFSANGEIFTAAHVLSGRVPIKTKDIEDPNIKYWVKFMGYPEFECKRALPFITVKSDFFNEDVVIDIATLIPKSKLLYQAPFITTLFDPPKLGDTVYFAGFSDEIELPFLGGKLSRRLGGLQQFETHMERNGNVDMINLMIKRGMVGNIREVSFGSSIQNMSMNADIYYIDNALHSGASGGPVVNENGEVVGVVTQRAVTKVSHADEKIFNLTVPAGSTVGLSLKPLKIFPQERA